MDISKARILHISKYYYPFIGGTEQVAQSLVKSLADSGAEQKVICFNEDAGDGALSCRRDETVTDVIDGVEVIRCGCLFKAASQSVSSVYGKELRKLMDRFQPTLVFFHYPNPFAAHYLLKYRNRDFRLLIYWHLDITKQKVLKHFFHGQNLALIQRADRIIGATPMHVDTSAYTAFFGKKRCILPYMIDEDSLRMNDGEAASGKRIKEQYAESILAFFIGRHVAYKGLNCLIRASGELNGTNIRFLIAGDGELTDSLKEQAKGDAKIRFLGRLTDSERKAYLYAADIICLPSVTRSEGFGLALAEGMYFGHPAVTFTIPGSGVNYVNLNGVTGIECPNGDTRAYASAVRRLAEDEALRKTMGEAARKRVRELCSPAAFQSRLTELLNGL